MVKNFLSGLYNASAGTALGLAEAASLVPESDNLGEYFDSVTRTKSGIAGAVCGVALDLAILGGLTGIVVNTFTKAVTDCYTEPVQKVETHYNEGEIQYQLITPVNHELKTEKEK